MADVSKVSKKFVRELLKDSEWMVDEDLSKEAGQVYRHSDGRLLVVLWGGNGRLIEANESQAFIDMIEATKTFIKENPRGRHILVDRLPQGADFIARVPNLIAQLPSLLKLSPDDLDFSQDSLLKIDVQLKKQGRVKCTTPPLFPALVAYVGEMQNRKAGTIWRMRHDTVDVRVWEPWLVYNEKRACNLAANMFDALNELYLSLHKIVKNHDLRWRDIEVAFGKQLDEPSE
ncbi:MAG: hypothetical protein LCI00_28040 [Chloroflexi bacterium]|nr:hypothetical protein [Chloroflexota bacterium]MCC6893902.1 hypothetical protein [Anaerolineae bacterium]